MFQRVTKFVFDIYTKREILYELSKRDFQKQYMGSYLGFVWVYLQPLLFISILYLVFTLGFKPGNSGSSTPFVVYLVVGIIPWFYFSTNLAQITNVIAQNAFLLKKVDFRLSLLPIVKLASSALPHLFFILIIFIIASLNHIYPSWYSLQLIYYYLCMVLLLLGIGWLTSSTKLFVSDVSNIISLFISFGFWLTPIFWNIEKVPESYQWIVKLNPLVYIIEGYRDSVIYHVWFWEKPYDTLYFWFITMMLLAIGISVFRRLRPHFAEVV